MTPTSRQTTHGDVAREWVATASLFCTVGLTTLFGGTALLAITISDFDAAAIATIGTILAAGGGLIAWSHL